MSAMKNARGLSLVEVLVAIAVLAIGVIGAVQLQASSLTASSRGESIQDATTIARAELEHRLQIILTPNPSEDCLAEIPDSFQCTAAVLPCTFASGAVSCSAGIDAGILGYEISVEATGPRGDTARLTSFVGSLVSAGGSTSDGDSSGGNNGNGEDEGGDDNGDVGDGSGGDGDDGGDGGGGDDGEDGGGVGGPGGGGGPPSCVPNCGRGGP